MSSVEPGSLGLVIFVHAARCLITTFSHCIDLVGVSRHIFVLWAQSVVDAFHFIYLLVKVLVKVFPYHFEALGSSMKRIAIELRPRDHRHRPLNLIPEVTAKALKAALVTHVILFWTIVYSLLLSLVLFSSTLVIFLETCETVYLHLRSSPVGVVVHKCLAKSRLGGSSLDQLGQSDTAMARILNVPRRSPSYHTSTLPMNQSQAGLNYVLRFTKNTIRRVLNGIESATRPRTLLEYTKVHKVSTRISHNQPPEPLTREERLYKVNKPVTFLSIFSNVLALKIVECWERFPTPTETLHIFHLEMKPTLSASERIEPKTSSKPTKKVPVKPHHRAGFVASQPASPKAVLSQATQPLLAQPSQQSPELPQQQHSTTKMSRSNSEEFNVMSLLQPGVTRRSSISGHDLVRQAALKAERRVSQQAGSSRKTSSSSTYTTSPFTGPSTPTATEANPLIITTAQPSEYWTGRFISLQDRFLGESLQAQSLSIFAAAHASKSTILSQQRAAYQGRGNLPLSTTTALDRFGSVTNQEANRLSEEDNRRLRIFLHLDTLCATPEAQKSLHAWQGAYARRMGREALLPKASSMEKGLVKRLFSGGRRSLGAAHPEKEKRLAAGFRPTAENPLNEFTA
ncbi:hypothetical protein CCHL11_09772 [Colletotrichum chlorophyti]|uniref:Uncharacterized protein n=1 Tax=Colletotrichum chlorophyti TaxID=708187 RepID=A0A1Q8RDP3_9PEZI|nr:hypothetical protein CCHL11_09772 [Colletotrichum chlorophyti]